MPCQFREAKVGNGPDRHSVLPAARTRRKSAFELAVFTSSSATAYPASMHYSQLLRFLVFQHELIDRRRRTKDDNVARVFGMAQEIAFGDELESSRFDFLAQYAFLNAMEGLPN